MPPSTPPPLRRVYESSMYRVFDASGACCAAFTFDRAERDASHELPFVRPWAILTAYNPRSRPLSDAENQARQRELITEIDSLQLAWWRAEGAAPHGAPPWIEPSLLVERMEIEQAARLLDRFDQNACVFCDRVGAGLLYRGKDAVDRAPLVTLKRS